MQGRGDVHLSWNLHEDTYALPPAQPVEETLWWLEDPYRDDNLKEPSLSLDQTRALHEQTEDNVLTQFLSSTVCVDFPSHFINLITSLVKNIRHIMTLMFQPLHQ